jgi:predicted transcriptional regulator
MGKELMTGGVSMNQSSNGDRFLAAFNRVEHALKEIVGAKNYMPFYRLVDLAKKKTVVVKKYQDDLKTYADLRNAIVHNRTAVDYIIAEPHIGVVERLEEIDRHLNSPQNVLSVCSKGVQTFQITASLNEVLQVIHQHKYTQFPIYNGNEFQGLLTTVSITRWIAAQITAQGHLPTTLPTLQELSLQDEKGKNYQFVAKDTSVLIAEEVFKAHIGKGRRIEALLVTEHGHSHEKLLGIITPMDIVEKV